MSRPIPCPLCHAPVKPEHLAPTGTCYYCHDERLLIIKESNRTAIQKESARASLAKRMHSRIKTWQKELEEKKREQEERKKLTIEKKRLLEIHKESAQLALARKSLLYYTERRLPQYKSNWFTEDLARNIERFYEDVVAGKQPRLILSVAARAGKSEMASCSGPAWALGVWPHLRFILASYSDDLPIKFSRQIRAQLQSDDYKRIFPNGARLSKYDAAANAWTTEHGGGVKTASVTSGLLGHGCDVLVLDDIISSAAVADNPKLLEATYDWATSTAMSRLSEKSGVLVIAQRLAPMDLIGRLMLNQKEEEARLEDMRREIEELSSKIYLNDQEKEHLYFLTLEADELDKSIDRWTVVEYPALATQEEYLTPDKRIIRIADKREVQPDWTLLRKIGDALQPERYSRSFLLKLKRANPNRFNAMYMLSPVAETGDFFIPDDFMYYEPGKHPSLPTMHVYCAFDLAISTKATADYTVGVAGGVDHEGNLYLLDIVRGRFGDLDLTADIIIDLHTRWNATITGVEKSALELALSPIINRKMHERQQYIMLADGKMALKPISDKKVRARTLQALAKQKKLYIPNSGGIWDEFVAELTNFPLGTHDDMVDAAAYVAILQSRDGLPKAPEDKSKPKNMISDIYGRLFRKFDFSEHDDSSYMSS